MMKYLFILIIHLVVISTPLISQEIFITPNNTNINREEPINLEWESEGFPVDLYYSYDQKNWILEASDITVQNYTFYIPNDADNEIYFKIDYKKIVDVSLVQEFPDAHLSEIRTALFSPDGKYVYSGSRSNIINKWDIESGQLLWSIPSDSPDNIIYDMDIDASGNFLVVARKTRLLVFNDVGVPIAFKSIPGDCRSVEISENGEIVAIGTNDGDLYIYSFDGNNLIQITEKSYGENNGIYSIDISKDNSYLIHSGMSDYVSVINLTSAEFFETLLPTANALMWDAIISPNNKHIIYGTVTQEIGQWLLAEELPVYTMNPHQGHIRSLEYHPSGKYYISGSLDRKLYEYQEESGEKVRTIDHLGQILDVDYSPTGDTILTAGRDTDDIGYAIKLWSEGRQVTFYDSIKVNIFDNARVYLNKIGGVADEKRTIQLVLETTREKEDNFEFDFTIRFPYKLFEPIDQEYLIQGNWGIVEIQKSIPVKNGVIHEFDGRLLVSDINSDSVYIDNFDIINAPYEIEEENGFIEIYEWCPGYENTRLLIEGGSEIIQIVENPVNDILRINVNFVVDGNYSIDINNINGEKVRNIIDEYLQHGYRELQIEINDLPSGNYFINVGYEDRIHSKKFIKID